MNIEFKNAYYIKLGSEGQWEESSIDEGKIRIGWVGQSLDDINARNWDKIREQLENEISTKGAVTRDLNALKKIALTTPDDIWITFYKSHLWWCRVDSGKFKKDKDSKFRLLSENWSNKDSASNPMIISNISGKLSKIQGFRGTICDVKEIEYLKRLLSNQPSNEFVQIEEDKNILTRAVSESIRLLHWSDFETLIDILFTRAGWQRISSVGKTQKFIDMEYREPVSGKLYQVQVKSSSGMKEYLDYASKFCNERFEKLYYVVHSNPDGKLPTLSQNHPDVELLMADKIAKMVIDLGALGWLMEKVK